MPSETRCADWYVPKITLTASLDAPLRRCRIQSDISPTSVVTGQPLISSVVASPLSRVVSSSLATFSSSAATPLSEHTAITRSGLLAC